LLNEPEKGSEGFSHEQMNDYYFAENLKDTIDEEIADPYSDEAENEIIESQPAETDKKNNTSCSLLIIEDNQDMRNYLKNSLQCKYQVFEANDGEKGLKLAEQREFDLVVSDIMMPKINGIEFCRRMKNDINTSHIPVILLTAKSLVEHQIEGYETGADDYVIKPFNNKLLHAKIESILENRRILKKKFSEDFSFEPKEVKLPSADKEFLIKLVNLMEDHISDASFNVDKMAKMMFISRTHFIRKVKNLSGQKPLDLLKSYRLKRAKQLLEQKKISISEVAYLVGYENPSSFTRAFKTRFNQSPSKFVESLT